MVTTTTDLFGDRPVAKAFGASLSAIPTRGLGISAMAHSRSTTACSCGACSGVTSTARIAFMDKVSENHHCPNSSAPLSPRMRIALKPKAYRAAASTTYNSPRPNRVPNMRAVKPRSVPYRVRATASDPSL